jgi:hypothetical protein
LKNLKYKEDFSPVEDGLLIADHYEMIFEREIN